jgi:HD-GYP domain-containing protein (c-di-GMP phosphodiesterase class II)
VLIADKGHDDGHAAHALSVMTLSLLLGKQAQLPEQALRVLGTGALLHDIGKRLISPSILRNSERNRHEEAIYPDTLP